MQNTPTRLYCSQKRDVTLQRFIELHSHRVVLIPSVVTSRPTTVSRPSNPLNPSPLVPQIQLLLTVVHVHKLYLLTHLLGKTVCMLRASVGGVQWILRRKI